MHMIYFKYFFRNINFGLFLLVFLWAVSAPALVVVNSDVQADASVPKKFRQVCLDCPWSKTFDLGHPDQIKEVYAIQETNNDLLVVASLASVQSGPKNLYVLHLDLQGKIKTLENLGLAYMDYVDVNISAEGKIALIGRDSQLQYFTQTLTTNGSTQVDSPHALPAGFGPRSLFQGPGGNLIVAGSNQLTAAALEMDSKGDLVWFNSYSFPEIQASMLSSITIDQYGYYIFGGDAYFPGSINLGIFEPFLLTVHANGSVVNFSSFLPGGESNSTNRWIVAKQNGHLVWGGGVELYDYPVAPYSGTVDSNTFEGSGGTLLSWDDQTLGLSESATLMSDGNQVAALSLRLSLNQELLFSYLSILDSQGNPQEPHKIDVLTHTFAKFVCAGSAGQDLWVAGITSQGSLPKPDNEDVFIFVKRVKL